MNSFQTPMIEVALYNQRRYRYGLVKPMEVRSILLRHFRAANWLHRADLEALIPDFIRLAEIQMNADVKL